MKCILHIGTEKTATTSFQKLFRSKRLPALELGLWYPKCLGPYWHRDLATYALGMQNADNSFHQHRISNDHELAAFRRRLEYAFAEEYNANNRMRYCLISSEHFHSRVRRPEELLRIKTFLDGFFDEYRVVVHLRPQVEMLVSLASTVAGGRGIVDRMFFEGAKMRSHYYNYDIFLRLWESVFGQKSIDVVSFQRNPNLVEHLSSVTALPLSALGSLPRENTALDVQTIALLNCAKRQGFWHEQMLSRLKCLPVRQKIALDRMLVDKIQADCAPFNELVCNRYSSINTEDLLVLSSSFPEKGNLDILQGRCDFPLAIQGLIEMDIGLYGSSTMAQSP